MTNMKLNGFKFAAGLVALSAFTGLLAPATASAALVSGNATLTFDNGALVASTTSGSFVEKHWGASDNNLGITNATTGGSTFTNSGSTGSLLFPVNSNTTTTTCVGNCGPYGRTLQATTMDALDTSVGQIGLSGALRTNGPFGVLTPFDLNLTKIAGIWTFRATDNIFGTTNFMQLTGVTESLDANNQLLLSGNLQMAPGGWAQLMGANTNAVIGSFSLAPAAVPVPAAVWMFGSGLLGLLGVARRKSVVAA